MGIKQKEIRKKIEEEYGKMKVQKIKENGKSYDVIIEIEKRKKWDEKRIGEISEKNMQGVIVKMESLEKIKRKKGKVKVKKKGKIE